MRLSSWISSLRNRLAISRATSSRRHLRATKRALRSTPTVAGQSLESRTLLAATGVLINQELSIFADEGESITVQRNSTTGNVEVLLSGGVVATSIPGIDASTVTALNIFTDAGDNTIDVSAVTSSDFSSLTTLVIDAGDGNDMITGSDSFNDSILGNDGNDTIIGGAGDDTLDGDDGDDSIVGGAGIDSIIGEDGDDIIDGGDDGDIIDAGNGQDSVLGGAGADNINSGDGNDTVDGGADNDTLNGSSGNDSIDGGSGDDTVFGGSENDTINGGSGSDSLNGQGGDDVVNGQSDDDTLIGGSGRDSLSGESGIDFLNGNSGNDFIDGGTEDDRILGGSGDDSLTGRQGNDTIRGHSGNDTLVGSTGEDSLSGDSGDDILDGRTTGISVSDPAIVTEGDTGTTSIVFTVQIDRISDVPVSVDIATSDGTATVADSDYVALPQQTVTVQPGSLTTTVSVTVNGDATFENDETVFLDLSNAVNGEITDAQGQGAIADDDALNGAMLGLNYTGTVVAEVGVIPPNPMGAVGPDHVLQLTNGRFVAYEKATGNEVFSSTLQEFWLDNGAMPQGETFNARTIYDPNAGRWFLSSVDFGAPGSGGVGNTVLLAVSNSSDPTQGWQTVQFVGDSAGLTFNARGRLGVDDDGVYIGTTNVTPNLGITSFSFYSIPKADLLATTPSLANLSRFETLDTTTVGFSSMPSTNFDNSDDRAVFIGVDFAGSTRLIRTDISGTGGAGATLGNSVDITVPAYAPAAAARQPGGVTPLQTNSPEISAFVVEESGNLWVVHPVLDPAGGNSAVRWYRIDEATNTVLETGLISDPNLDFIYPSIAVNTFGDVIIAFTASGPTQNPSSFFVRGNNSGGVTSFLPPTVARDGVDTYFIDGGQGNQFGTYSATAVDWTNESRIWTFQEVADAQNSWGVAITEIQVRPDPVSPPVQAPVVFSNNDTAIGGSGDDTILTGTGNDRVNGGSGNDSITDSGGNDSIQGGDGNDTIDGGSGDDTIAGQGGDDVISTGSGNDTVEWNGAGNGVDTVQDSTGSQSLNVQGDSGVNNFEIDSNSGLLRITEGGASITVSNSTSNVTLNGSGGDDNITLNTINDVRALILNVDGGAGADTITATSALYGDVRVQLNGGTGNDTISGGLSADSINGDEGDDSLLGAEGNDNIDGGDGNDTLIGGVGDDTLLGNLGNDRTEGGDGNDSMNGSFGNDTLVGGNGNDTGVGGFGRDVFNGNSGNDLGYGNADRDTLLGGSGNDSLDGGTGDDTLRGQSDNDQLKGGDGNDRIIANGGDDTIDAGDGNDNIDAGSGNDIVNANDGDDTINGMSGADTLLGGDGNDNQIGGSGIDSLYGQDGDDSLNGGGSTDQFNGGEGVDVLVSPDAGEVDNNNLTIEASVTAALAMLNGF